jgi:hypothetical protein
VLARPERLGWTPPAATFARSRYIATVVAAVIVVSSTLALPILAAAQQAAEPAAAAASRERLYLVIFSLGPAWVAGKPPGEQTAFREHGQNLKRLRDADRIAMGARYADKGMIVLRSETEAAARGEIEADPGVRAGIFTFELNELVPFYSGYVGSTPRK